MQERNQMNKQNKPTETNNTAPPKKPHETQQCVIFLQNYRIALHFRVSMLYGKIIIRSSCDFCTGEKKYSLIVNLLSKDENRPYSHSSEFL